MHTQNSLERNSLPYTHDYCIFNVENNPTWLQTPGSVVLVSFCLVNQLELLRVYCPAKGERRKFVQCHIEINAFLCLVIYGSSIFISIIFLKAKYIFSHSSKYTRRTQWNYSIFISPSHFGFDIYTKYAINYLQ